ncbi:MAG: penicillin-binding protein 2 [bacterium]
MKKKISSLIIIFFLLFFVLLISSFYLQIIRGSYFKNRSLKNRIRIIPHPQSRGMIFDRKGKVLATNVANFSISIIQEGLSDSQIEDILSKISSLMQFDREKAKKSMKKKSLRRFEPATIIENISKDDALKIASAFFDTPSLVIDAKPLRDYPNSELASHLLGYVGLITEKEFKEKEGYLIDDRIGKSGIERKYEDILKGRMGGDVIETNVSGRTIRVLGKEEAIPGCTLYLTIDKELQEIGERALYKNGAIVALSPKTGEVLCMVSKPGFNPSLFLKKLSLKEAKETILSTSYPLANRAIQFRYPPGSLFKIIDAYLGLEGGIVDPNEYIECDGRFDVGNRKFSCFRKQRHGKINIISALSHSCNIYFYQLGLKIGAGKLIEGAKIFGLSSLTDIDLPYEIKGKIPSPSWKERLFKTRWFAGDTINLSIGQGYLLATPLEIAIFVSCIANSGNIFKPYIVQYIEYPDGRVIMKKPVLKKKIRMLLKTKRILDKGLEEVVLSGTGRGAYIPEIRIAGKTGTAENPQGKDHAWFVCYAPVDDPSIVVVVLVEHGGQGGIEAAPIARKILAGYFGIKERIETFGTETAMEIGTETENIGTKTED